MPARHKVIPIASFRFPGVAPRLILMQQERLGSRIYREYRWFAWVFLAMIIGLALRAHH
jgi:hypothetical protein